MEGFQIDDCLKSMVILVDKREQKTERAERRYKSFSVPYKRETLNYGDYSAEFTLPDGKVARIHAAIERKMSLEELSTCLTHERDRFEREFQRAEADEASMYLLIEDATWENMINGKYKTLFNPKAFFCSTVAWVARYDLKPIFCKQETSGKMIQEILYRELKERLESGIYG